MDFLMSLLRQALGLLRKNYEKTVKRIPSDGETFIFFLIRHILSIPTILDTLEFLFRIVETLVNRYLNMSPGPFRPAYRPYIQSVYCMHADPIITLAYVQTRGKYREKAPGTAKGAGTTDKK